MKQKKDYTLAALVIPFFMAILFNGPLPSCTSDKAKDEGYFKQGQILYPDYACTDTLVVFDADGLNLALKNSKAVEGDAAIDSLFHDYCEEWKGLFADKFNRIKTAHPEIDSITISNRIINE